MGWFTTTSSTEAADVRREADDDARAVRAVVAALRDVETVPDAVTRAQDALREAFGSADVTLAGSPGTLHVVTPDPSALSRSRRAVLDAVADLVGQTASRLERAQQADEAAQDSHAVTEVLAALSGADDEQEALRTALDTVRRCFDWEYGSVWQIRMADLTPVLRFHVESGSVNSEFSDITRTATFAEGVGLSGRAWRERRLVFVADLAEVIDCVRAPAARKAGVKSGVCLPIAVDGEVIATMDFFATRTLTLSENRLAALSSVANLVGQTLARLRRTGAVTQMAGELSLSVQHVAAGAARASAVASDAVAAAQQALILMEVLQRSSRDIGDITKVIAGIAGQTNLLALNATIEAARAGDAGKGFAVVAQEVKDLSRETSQATDDVSKKIEAIQADTATASISIDAITQTITEIHEIQNDLAAVLEEQSTIAQAFLSPR